MSPRDITRIAPQRPPSASVASESATHPSPARSSASTRRRLPDSRGSTPPPCSAPRNSLTRGGRRGAHQAARARGRRLGASLRRLWPRSRGRYRGSPRAGAGAGRAARWRTSPVQMIPVTPELEQKALAELAAAAGESGGNVDGKRRMIPKGVVAMGISRPVSDDLVLTVEEHDDDLRNM